MWSYKGEAESSTRAGRLRGSRPCFSTVHLESEKPISARHWLVSLACLYVATPWTRHTLDIFRTKHLQAQVWRDVLHARAEPLGITRQTNFLDQRFSLGLLGLGGCGSGFLFLTLTTLFVFDCTFRITLLCGSAARLLLGKLILFKPVIPILLVSLRPVLGQQELALVPIVFHP